MPDPRRDYLTLLLDQYWFAPPVALWRAMELRTLAAERFPRPILDVGCGDGLIAQALFRDDPPVEVGFDPWLDQVRKSPATGAYIAVQQAAGDAMPYADDSFGSVLSNSVLEHIPDLDPVLREIARVVRPGGRVLFTVPSDAFRHLLAGYRDRAAVGDRAGAEAYAAEIDAWLAHYRYPTPDEWDEMLAHVGLRLLRTVYYVPTEVMVLWDRANGTYGVQRQRGLPFYRWLASPRLRRLGYQRWIRRRIVRVLGQRWRQAYAMDVPAGDTGGGLLVVGEKAA
jgi:SAM-dependent methyltransferase